MLNKDYFKISRQLVEDFANDSSVAIGGNIKVTLTDYSTKLQPKVGYKTVKPEDCTYLDELITGALHLTYWLERNGMKIIKKKVKNVK